MIVIEEQTNPISRTVIRFSRLNSTLLGLAAAAQMAVPLALAQMPVESKTWTQNEDGTWSVSGDGHRYRFASPPTSTDKRWIFEHGKRDVRAEIEAQNRQVQEMNRRRFGGYDGQAGSPSSRSRSRMDGWDELERARSRYQPQNSQGGSQQGQVPYGGYQTPAYQQPGYQQPAYQPAREPVTASPTRAGAPGPARQEPPSRDMRPLGTQLQAQPAAPARLGVSHAVFFATDQYNDPRFRPLRNPINDARALAEDLRTYYGFQTRLVENPDLKTMLSVIREYADRKYDKTDQLLIFFGGHGTFDDVFKMGYIVARDSRADDKERFTFLSSANLLGLLDRINCEHVLVCLDVCFGGTFDDYVAQNFASTSRGDEDIPEMSLGELLSRRARFRTRKMLAASGNEPVSDGVPGRHSPFSARILEALRTYGGKDGYLTFGEISKFVERVKPGPHAVEFGSNQPGSDFFFVPKGRPAGR